MSELQHFKELQSTLFVPENIGLLRCVSLGLLGMAFAPKIREWWLRVSNGECQYEFYDEKKGWQKCHKPARHIHHVIPDGWTRDRGGDPDENVGMGLCQEHHVRNFSEEEHSDGFSFHPDMARAYKDYREWKLQHQQMERIAGHRTPRDSPFDEAVQDHREKSKKGERYWAGTPELDAYYEQKMRDMATKHIAENPEDKKPVINKRTYGKR